MGSRPELKVRISDDTSTSGFANSPQLDDEGGFIRFFKALPEVGNDSIRIFDRGDWYTAHGDDATFIAQTVRPTQLASGLDTDSPHRSTRRLPCSASSVAAMTQALPLSR